MRVLLFLVCLLFGYILHAQLNAHAIGLRLGGGDDLNDIEVSYQHGYGGSNRLELDLGLGSGRDYNRFFLAGIYHWNWNMTTGLNWYIGPGAALSLYSPANRRNRNEGEVSLGFGGQIGIEYDFNTQNAPILVSLDWRPMWHFFGDYFYGFGWGAALGVRYTWR